MRMLYHGLWNNNGCCCLPETNTIMIDPAVSPARRLFFALWPPEAVAEALRQWAILAHAGCGGRVMRPETLHITLAFLGAADPAMTRTLIELTRRFTVTPGRLTLSRFGSFPRTGIVWAGPAAVDPLLDDLHQRLWQALAPSGWAMPAQPFRPHVTLLRRAACQALPPEPALPIVWPYTRCVLVASEPGSRYRVLAHSRSGRGNA